MCGSFTVCGLSRITLQFTRVLVYPYNQGSLINLRFIMLQTTVYNQGNAVITGCYYNAKGNKIDVEYMGSALECAAYISGVRQDNDGTNEVQYVVNRVDNTGLTHINTNFALHSVWGNVVAA